MTYEIKKQPLKVMIDEMLETSAVEVNEHGYEALTITMLLNSFKHRLKNVKVAHIIEDDRYEEKEIYKDIVNFINRDIDLSMEGCKNALSQFINIYKSYHSDEFINDLRNHNYSRNIVENIAFLENLDPSYLEISKLRVDYSYLNFHVTLSEIVLPPAFWWGSPSSTKYIKFFDINIETGYMFNLNGALPKEFPNKKIGRDYSNVYDISKYNENLSTKMNIDKLLLLAINVKDDGVDRLKSYLSDVMNLTEEDLVVYHRKISHLVTGYSWIYDFSHIDGFVDLPDLIFNVAKCVIKETSELKEKKEQFLKDNKRMFKCLKWVDLHDILSDDCLEEIRLDYTSHDD